MNTVLFYSKYRLNSIKEKLAFYDNISLYDLDLIADLFSHQRDLSILLELLSNKGYLYEMKGKIKDDAYLELLSDIKEFYFVQENILDSSQKEKIYSIANANKMVKYVLSNSYSNKNLIKWNALKIYSRSIENFLSNIIESDLANINPAKIRLDYAERLNIVYNYETIPCISKSLKIMIPKISEENDIDRVVDFRNENKIIERVRKVFRIIEKESNINQIELLISDFVSSYKKDVYRHKLRIKSQRESSIITYKLDSKEDYKNFKNLIWLNNENYELSFRKTRSTFKFNFPDEEKIILK